MSVLDQRARKPVSIKELLRWTYGRQLADLFSIHTLDEKSEPRGTLPGFLSWAQRFRTLAELGAAVDCSSSSRFARGDLHPDAELVHGAVLERGPIYARLLIEFGRTGILPEREIPIARPVPFERAIETGTRGGRPPARRKGEGIESWEWQEGEGKPAPQDRCGQCDWRDEGMLYTIRVAETIIERVPVFVIVGRRRTKISHYETKRVDVEYCPIDWNPDLAWSAATAAVADHFDAALEALRARLAELEFRDHELVDVDKA